MSTGSAPGKAILFGEHAVVYGQPALAVPVPAVRATVQVRDLPSQPSGRVRLLAPDIGLDAWLHEIQAGNPLAAGVQTALDSLAAGEHAALDALAAGEHAALEIQVSSTIPVASGLGSSAAVAVALLRALSHHFRLQLSAQRLSEIAYQMEVLQHGTPSGIDNTVIAFERPVFFRRIAQPELLSAGSRMFLVIGDSGVVSSTGEVVARVRRAWKAEGDHYETIFRDIGSVATAARTEFERGDSRSLGHLMDRNQRLLQQLGVSCEPLESLIHAARSAGALGAKLSGAGAGGNMIALVQSEMSEAVASALRAAGATQTIQTTIEA